MVVEEGIILIQDNKGDKKIYIPENWRLEIIRAYHDEETAAHAGFFKTYNRIKKLFYWPNQKADISEHIRKCAVCLGIKPTNKRQETPIPPKACPNQAFQQISIDFVGPLPRTKTGHTCIIVAIDYFSKFTIAQALRQATAETAITFLANEIIYKYGAPNEIVSDRGKQFESHRFQEYLSEHGIDWRPTAAYNPQANSAEAVNKVIGNGIKAYIQDNNSHNQWDRHLTQIIAAINSSTHSTTKISPYEALFGYPYIEYGANRKHIARVISPASTSKEANKNFKALREKIFHSIQKSRSEAHKRYNLRTRNQTYEKGTQVWRRNFKLSNKAEKYASKLAPRYLPCHIKEKVGKNTYRLIDESGRERTYPAKHLK